MGLIFKLADVPKRHPTLPGQIGRWKTLREVEEEYIRRVLAAAETQEEAAMILGINVSTLHRRRKGRPSQSKKVVPLYGDDAGMCGTSEQHWRALKQEQSDRIDAEIRNLREWAEIWGIRLPSADQRFF